MSVASEKKTELTNILFNEMFAKAKLSSLIPMIGSFTHSYPLIVI
ncbi:hypothetical protein JMUB7504_27600 [Staphylococcus aureus]